MVKLPTSIFSPASSLTQSTKKPPKQNQSGNFSVSLIKHSEQKGHQWYSWSKIRHTITITRRRNQYLPLLPIFDGRIQSPLFLSWGWEWTCGSVTHMRPTQTQSCCQRGSLLLSHSHGHTALPSAPAPALLYPCLLEVVLTGWNITGQLQSAKK